MMKKQNVLHLVEYLYLGGIERLLEQLALNTGNQANIHFFTYETETLKGIGKQIQDHGFPVYIYKKNQGRDWKLLSVLIKVIKEKKIDVIHTHDFGPVEYAVLLKLRFPRIKLIHTQHTVINFIRHMKYTMFFQLASYFYSRIIAVSKSTEHIIRKCCPLMNMASLRVIPNGVDANIFKSNDQIFEKNSLKLVSISRISNEKNLIYIFNTCRLLKAAGIPFSFHHAGTAKTQSLIQEIETFIEKHDLKNEITLHGFTNDAKAVLNLGDIFLSASNTEGHPVAVLEAMACEKLCFCSSIPPHTELGNSLIYFDHKDQMSLFNFLIKHYEGHNGFNAEVKTKSARAHILSNFTIETMAQRYVEQYN